MISGFQEVDIHGMTKAQAFTAIDAKLRRAGGAVYTLRVIHGYHGGTVLRDAVRSHYKNHPKVIRVELGLNPGETDLKNTGSRYKQCGRRCHRSVPHGCRGGAQNLQGKRLQKGNPEIQKPILRQGCHP